METKANYVMVGVFVLALLGVAAMFVLWLAGPRTDEAAHFLVRFDGDVTGLSDGSVVRYRGIRVGEVTGIAIDRQSQRVEVSIKIAQGTPIKTDTIARLEVQGITGVAFVQLTGGSPSSADLEPAEGERLAIIRSERSTLQRVFADIPVTLERIATLSERISEVFDEKNRAAISQSLENVRIVTQAMADRSEDIDRALSTAGGAFQAIDDIASGLGPAMTDVSAGAKAFARASIQLDELVTEIRTPITDFSATGLYEMTLFLTEARSLVQSLNRITAKLESDPARFLFGDTQKGFESR